jgi:hypothetical protein
VKRLLFTTLILWFLFIYLFIKKINEWKWGLGALTFLAGGKKLKLLRPFHTVASPHGQIWRSSWQFVRNSTSQKTNAAPFPPFFIRQKNLRLAWLVLVKKHLI